ncbi:MAG TPA: hypothetical protein VG778_03040, partial [Blastocatellia bacterium]|nr:hypothetical protein [Blastocatellia bacterium]
MKTLLSFLTSFLLLSSCGAESPDGIVFKVAQPMGQKSSYAMKNNVVTKASDPMGSMEMTMEATFETEVTAAAPNGNWTIATKFTSADVLLNGAKQPE